MRFDQIHSVYFIGIGGIGMSAIARYFNALGKRVGGYDRTRTDLTDQLQAEGILVHYDESVEACWPDADLVVYTPAIPDTMPQLVWYRASDRPLMKRSQVLGLIS